MDEIDFIGRLFEELGPFVRGRAAERGSLEVSEKSEAADLVTGADYEVQRRVERALGEAFGGDALVAEEGERDEPPVDRDERCWVLDPIDGTHNFARGFVPCYGISLACVVNNQPVAAGVALPGLGEVLLAERGGGATRNGRPMRVSDIADMERARIEIDWMRPSMRARSIELGSRVLERAGQVRSYGCFVVGMAELAAGGGEAYVHAGPQPWDMAAAMLLVREAGGRVTRLDGADAGVFDGKVPLIASNGRMHEAMLGLVGE